jgi:hypothetical protein
MVRGLAAPLLYMAALTTSVALYHSLSEVGGTAWGTFLLASCMSDAPDGALANARGKGFSGEAV